MTSTLHADPIARSLTGLAPELSDDYAAALPRATQLVTRRLLGAVCRERLAPVAWAGGRTRLAGDWYRMRRYGFGRIEVDDPVSVPLRRVLGALGLNGTAVAHEMHDACRNLALAYARRTRADETLRTAARLAGAPDLLALAEPLPADEQMLLFERLSTAGHNLHPCGRTRLGWSLADVLAHDLESPGTAVAFVAVQRSAHTGDDVGGLLRAAYPWLPSPPPGYVLQPVHAWQLEAVVKRRHAGLVESGILRLVPGAVLRAAPTAALRTVLLEPDARGVQRYLKLSLDIQVTSTRRSISLASARNGPAVSALLTDLLADAPQVLLMHEVAGAAVHCAGRDMTAILRNGLSTQLHPGEVAVPAGALPATSPLTGRPVLAELVDRYPGTPLDFVEAYARLLLQPVLRTAAAGIGLEAHLQNSIPTFRDGVPYRIAFRDFAGLRIHTPRLHERTGRRLALQPGSVIATHDLNVLRAKAGYTTFQAHLGEILLQLAEARTIDEAAGWHRVRGVLEEARAADPDDHGFWTAPTMPHKALLRMRLVPDRGDIYVPVRNPLNKVRF
ncbi:MAG TPA: IucA/IucC family protein [Rugosimonospora sp.]|nr:IucA/IucC family protein [Rugosimonospora sp.]